MIRPRKKGFTLIELLVVLAIISMFATFVFAALVTARDRARTGKVQADLNGLQKAIALLEDATDETVGHYAINTFTCPTSVDPNELYLDTGAAGLSQTDGTFPNWTGPYVSEISNDPWGNRYIFDDDYTCAVGVLGCSNIVGSTRSIYSGGPNGSGINVYDADNIVLVLCRR